MNKSNANYIIAAWRYLALPCSQHMVDYYMIRMKMRRF